MREHLQCIFCLAVYPSKGRENSCVERERIESEKKSQVRKGEKGEKQKKEEEEEEHQSTVRAERKRAEGGIGQKKRVNNPHHHNNRELVGW